MTQSRYSVLVSLCLLLLLTVGFFEASRVVFNRLHSSIAAAVATATVVVLPPTPTRPPARATPKGGHTHVQAQATSTPTSGSPQAAVATTLSLGAASSVIASNSPQVYCMVNLPNVAPSAPLRIQFQKLPSAEDYFHHDGTADSYNTALKFAYIYGPLTPGQWQCQIFVSGSVVAKAPFTVK